MRLDLVSKSSKETYRIASRLGGLCMSRCWIGLTGELGAGKTCFVQGLARGLGVCEHTPVTSPTFVIHSMYPGRLCLHHLDLYRLDSIEELYEIGYEELLEQPAVTAVEWYQRIPEAIPRHGLTVRIDLIDEEYRRLELQSLDASGAELISRLGRIES